MTTEIWRKNMAVNMEGAFWTLRESVKHMVERAKAGDPGGSVVGVASLAGVEGAARNQAYAATKGGLPAMMRGIAALAGLALLNQGWMTDLAGLALIALVLVNGRAVLQNTGTTKGGPNGPRISPCRHRP